MEQIAYHIVGDNARVAAMKEAALAPLRRGILADGTIHPRVFARWRADDAYGPALRAIDDVEPGFLSSYGDAAQATQALKTASLEQRRQIDERQHRAAARALNRQDVEQFVGAMLSDRDGAAQMRETVRLVEADADALAGLRKAAVGWIVRTFLSEPRPTTSVSLIGFLTDGWDALRILLPRSQVAMLFSVARSIDADARWIASGAAADPTMASVAIEGLAGIVTTTIAASLNARLREAGIWCAEDLYRLMLLDAEVARLMIGKMPKSAENSKWSALTKALWPQLKRSTTADGDHAKWAPGR